MWSDGWNREMRREAMLYGYGIKQCQSTRSGDEFIYAVISTFIAGIHLNHVRSIRKEVGRAFFALD